jgi:hypothetical protein
MTLLKYYSRKAKICLEMLAKFQTKAAQAFTALLQSKDNNLTFYRTDETKSWQSAFRNAMSAST